MNKYEMFDNIINTIQQKYDRACYMYGFIDEDHCMWILGAEVCWILEDVSEWRYFGEEGDPGFLHGIPYIIDRKNKWRISLVKEIK